MVEWEQARHPHPPHPPNRRNSWARNSEYSNYPDINFNRLFSELGEPNQTEKLKCVFNYFRRIASRDLSRHQEGLLTFERRSISPRALPDWSRSNRPAVAGTKVHVDSEGTIEDGGFAMLQVDFANAFVGGGVLGHGCVQVLVGSCLPFFFSILRAVCLLHVT